MSFSAATKQYEIIPRQKAKTTLRLSILGKATAGYSKQSEKGLTSKVLDQFTPELVSPNLVTVRLKASS